MAISISKILEKAWQLQQAGRAAEATAQYTQILHGEPENAAALQALGALKVREGKHGEALALLDRALRLDLQLAEAHYNRGLALSNLDRLEEAAESMQRAIAVRPDYADALLSLGILLRALDRLAEAAGMLRRLIGIAPDLAEAHNNLGIVLCELGETDAAIASYRRTIALKPDAAEAYNNLGAALNDLDQVEEAVTACRRAVELKPDYADAWMNLGIALAKAKQLEEAEPMYRRAIEIDPDYVEAHNNLGIALTRLDRLDEALAAHRRAVEIDPSYAAAQLNLASALLRRKEYEGAVASYRQALATDPNSAAGLSGLGVALHRLERYDEAIACYRRALAINPDDAELHNQLGVALRDAERFDEAVASLQRAVQLRPTSADLLCNLGKAYYSFKRPTEAIEHFRKALVLRPEFDEALGNLGQVLVEIGRIDDGLRAFESAAKIAPRESRYLADLASAKRFTADDPHLAAMEMLARDMSELPAKAQIQLHFALGKVYGDLKDHLRSFDHLLEGAALKRKETIYDEAALLEKFRRAAVVFTPELLSSKRGIGTSSGLPVFVIGMPRSGTTLIEQILASHSKVFGAGELKEIASAVNVLQRAGQPPYPELVTSMSELQLRAFGEKYIEKIRALAPTAERIVDKMPTNFLYAGLIHLALPNARIIHARRDPVDNCVSCFSLNFNEGNAHTYDLTELGRYYRAYETLMAHWRQVLPEGVMIEVQYEDVVADLETQARRIVTHCGLEWDDACLAFHQTERSVRTASVTQVRQPIYATSVGRSQVYGDKLQPLLDALRIDALSRA